MYLLIHCEFLLLYVSDTHDAPALLGTLDSAFLFAYAGAMFLR